MRRRWRPRRLLSALQVEVTSRCTRECEVCPRSALAPVWRNGDLDDETWERLRPGLSLARHVHLQGWGEPLLHPRLREMAGAARAAGCRVGFTTNGDLLGENLDWIAAGGVDRITLSVAGDAGTHRRLRDGSRLEDLWQAVAELAARRGRRRSPRLQVSYLLTARNAVELPGVVERAARSGADEVFVVHLDCTPSVELLEEAAFESDGLRPGVVEALDAASLAARRQGIPFREPARTPSDLLVCAANPLRLACVTWDGRVGPCVNLLLPVAGPPIRSDASGTRAIDRWSYGNLHESSLEEILGDRRFRRFTGRFAARLAAEQRFLTSLDGQWGTEALERLDEADRRRTADLGASPFPGECAGCHKATGW